MIASSANDRNMIASSANDRNMIASSANDRNMIASSANDRNMIASSANDRNMIASSANDRNMIASSANDRNMIASSANDRNMIASSANDRNMIASSANDRNMIASSANDRKLNASSANDRNMNASSANDRNMNASSANDRNMNASSANDRNMNASSASPSQAVGRGGMETLTEVDARPSAAQQQPSDLPQPRPRTIVPTPTPRKNPANNPKSVDKDVQKKPMDNESQNGLISRPGNQTASHENVPLDIPDVHEIVFPMRKICEQMFRSYLKERLDTPQQREANAEIFSLDYIDESSEISLRGTLAGIKQAMQIRKDFQMNLMCLKKTLKLPCMTQFLQTQVWTQKRTQIEETLRCKILQESECPPDLLLVAFEDSITYGLDHMYATIGDSLLDSFRDVGFSAGTTPPSKQPEDPTSSLDLKDMKLCGKSENSTPNISFKITSDITTEEYCALVNTTNRLLNLKDGRVSSAFLEAGGQSIQDECRMKYPNGIKSGEIAVTSGGSLKCKNILHLSLPEEKNSAKIKSVVRAHVKKCLKEASRLKLASIGFPALGTGLLKYPPDLVAEAMYQSTIKYGAKHPKCGITDVTFIVHNKDQAVISAFEAEERKYRQSLRKSLPVVYKRPVLSVQQESKPTEIFRYFQEHQDNVDLMVLSSNPHTGDKVIQDLLKCYEESVKPITYSAPMLDSWDDHHITSLKEICADTKLDIYLIYSESVIKLRGLHEVLAPLPMRDLIREAEQFANDRQNAEIIAREVQWNSIAISETEEVLQPYSRINNYLIETAYRNGKMCQVVIVESVKQPVIIDFMTMEEYPEDPLIAADVNTLQIIRQDLFQGVDLDAPLPNHWSSMKGDIDMVPLSPDSQEYKNVAKAFRTNSKQPQQEIKKIARIQNKTLHKKYVAMKRKIVASLPSGKRNERDNMWHGTNEESMDGIARYGFNKCYSNCNAYNYGQGVYFTTEAESSIRNSYVTKNSSGEKHIFMCKVLVGEYTVGKFEMRFPPEIPGSNGRCYNSVVDDKENPSTFVIFSDVQAYPEYLITFK